tara:strand:+ start:1347 stop:1706 length:360 start_codon:yes stop_codon:yes gene_type:complete
MSNKKVTIYHNPKCKTSRDVLEVLKTNDFNIQIINYIKNPLNHKELNLLIKKLFIRPKEVIRKREPIFKELKLVDFLNNDEYLINKMVEFPKLIERPIVIIGNNAKICRPSKIIFNLIY